jgi:intracellular sulfur oxidation DsrE/DsrF family protein
METTDIRTGFTGRAPESNLMENRSVQKRSIFKYAFKYGILGGVCYIALFFLFKLLGLIETLELSLINIIVMAIVAFKALSNFKEDAYRQHGKMNYLQGYGTAFFTCAVSFAFLALFMFFYLSILDKGFMAFLQTKQVSGLALNPLSISIVLFFEGAGMGIIIALVLMQYFKK